MTRDNRLEISKELLSKMTKRDVSESIGTHLFVDEMAYHVKNRPEFFSIKTIKLIRNLLSWTVEVDAPITIEAFSVECKSLDLKVESKDKPYEQQHIIDICELILGVKG